MILTTYRLIRTSLPAGRFVIRISWLKYCGAEKDVHGRRWGQRIELIVAHVEKDAFENIVEIPDRKELDLYREPPGDYSGQLRIVEAEFYEKPSSLSKK